MRDHLELLRPDDWHVHLRDGPALRVTVPATAVVFGRAIVMPNLAPPVTTVEHARAYRDRILSALPDGMDFEPLMTLYLTPQTSVDEVARAKESGFVHAVKLYPAGATTNSDAGVGDLTGIYAVLGAMEDAGLPLLVHGEVTDADVDVFDRERVFIERHLAPIVDRFPGLPVVFEHITTREAAQFVEGARDGVAATITPQHLLMNRNHLFQGGVRPHHYCLPVLKRSVHQEALLDAACSGNPRYFLGTDSAPHARHTKERDCGCAGCYSAPAAISLYAEAFERRGALERLEGFASHHGADFYGLPRSSETIALRRETWCVPAELDYAPGEEIVPYWAGQELAWRVDD